MSTHCSFCGPDWKKCSKCGLSSEVEAGVRMAVPSSILVFESYEVKQRWLNDNNRL